MTVADQLSLEHTPTSSLLEQVSNDRDRLADVIEATALQANDPFSHKVARTYLPREVAELIGRSPSYVNTLAKELNLDVSRDANNKYRTYSLENIMKIRIEAARRVADNPEKSLQYCPRRRDGEELAVMAFVNFKGGSAKTTTSVHFAQYLALQGYRVLFLDLDPQGSASTVFGFQPVLIEADKSINAALRYENPLDLKDLVQETYFYGIDICLGGQWMTEWEQDTPRVMTEAHHYSDTAKTRVPALEDELQTPGLTEARVDEINDELAAWREVQATGDAALHYYLRLKHALKSVEDDYDIVVCDTQPALHFASQATIGAASHLLLTIQPEWLDVKSMHQYLTALGVHLDTLENNINNIGESARYTDRTMHYLITRFEQSDAAMSSIAEMMRAKLDNVLDHAMPKSAAISQAGLSNSTLYEGHGKDFNRNTYRRGLEALNAANREIEEIVLKGWGRI